MALPRRLIVGAMRSAALGCQTFGFGQAAQPWCVMQTGMLAEGLGDFATSANRLEIGFVRELA